MLAELPLFHSFGLTVNVLLCLIEGTPMVVVADPTDVKTMARVCAEFHVTAFVGTPSVPELKSTTAVSFSFTFFLK